MYLRDVSNRLVSFCFQREVQYLYHMDIAQTLKIAPPPVQGLTQIVCDANNLEQVKEVIKPFPYITESFIKRGDLAFLAVQESQWIFRSNVVLGVKEYHVTGCPLYLGKLDAFLECAETIPSWRGRGVAPGMLHITMQTLLDRGYTRAFMCVAINNTASCKAVEKGGAQRIGIIASQRVLGRWKASFSPLTEDRHLLNSVTHTQQAVAYEATQLSRE